MDGRADGGPGVTVNSIANSRFSRSTRERDLILVHGAEGSSAPQEALNAKAVQVIRRVQDKLAGLDFGNKDPYDVDEQVDRLIQQVTEHSTVDIRYKIRVLSGKCPTQRFNRYLFLVLVVVINNRPVACRVPPCLHVRCRPHRKERAERTPHQAGGSYLSL